MDITPKFKKVMSKDEVSLLVDLIANNPILTSKETNASTNKLKEDTWTALADNFNSKSGSIPRTKEQLKLKWDNLKKAARKRTQAIRMNNLKTGGGKPEYIPVDEVLEKVASLLGSTGAGFIVPFGGDGVGGHAVVLDSNDELDFGGGSDNNENLSTNNNARVTVPEVEFLNQTPSIGKQERKRKLIESAGSSPVSSKYFFGTPLPNPLKPIKKGKNKDNSSVAERNIAIARYYDKKTEKLELELQLLRLRLESEKKEQICRNCNVCVNNSNHA